MKQIKVLLLFVLFSLNVVGQTEVKSVIGSGGGMFVNNISPCFYSISIAGEMASSGVFTAGALSGNIGFLHSDDSLDISCIPLETQTLVSNEDISLFPNPNNGAFTIRLYANAGKEGDIKIVDLWGRVLHEQRVKVSSGANDYYFQNFRPGVYFVRIETGNDYIKSLKVLVE